MDPGLYIHGVEHFYSFLALPLNMAWILFSRKHSSFKLFVFPSFPRSSKRFLVVELAARGSHCVTQSCIGRLRGVWGFFSLGL